MELKRQTETALDISAGGVVLTYDYIGTLPIEVVARVDLGLPGGEIAGAGAYTVAFRIDDMLVSPTNQLTIPAGQTDAILVTRPVPLLPDDTLTVTVTGRPGDTAVNTRTSLRDMTAVKQSDVTGVGAVAVDHNYGGADALTVVAAGGARVDNASVRAYRQADYAAGRRTPEYVVGQTYTAQDGRWSSPIMLDPGTYTLLIFKQGVIQSKAVSVTVV